MFDPVPIPPEHSAYPNALSQLLGKTSSLNLSAIGYLDMLRKPAIALFCSTKCPEHLIRHTYSFASKIRATHIPIIGGFHSSVEKECLKLLMIGTQPCIHCPARSLHNLRLSQDQKTAIAAQRLLLLSYFPASQRRATAALAEQRNRLVETIATVVFIAYAAPGSKTEKLAKTIAAKNKPFFTFDSPDTQNLQQLGAVIVDVETELAMLLGNDRPLTPHH